MIGCLASALALGCNSPPSEADAAIPDASSEELDGGETFEAGSLDAGELDAGDAGEIDAADAAADICGPSTDLLTNPAHCGACGHDCEGGACIDGACQPFRIVRLPLIPDQIVADDRNLFVAWQGDGRTSQGFIERRGLDGTSPATLFTTAPLVQMTAMSVDAGYVYWYTQYPVDEMRRVPRVGGAYEVVAGGLVEQPGESRVEGDYIVWSGRRVRSAPILGGTFVELTNPDDTVLAGLTGRLGTVFFVATLGGTRGLWSVPAIGDRSPTLVLEHPSVSSFGLTLVDDYLYWSNGNDVYRWPLSGGIPELVAHSRPTIRWLEVGTSELFFVADDPSGTTNTIYRAPVDGSAAPVAIVELPYLARRFAANDTYLFTSTQASGDIDRIVR